MGEKPLDRESLKAIFSNGNRPNQNNFGSFIDSMVNKVDDGISKNIKDGLILSPEGDESDRLVSFYEKIQDDLPQWGIQLAQDGQQGLGVIQPISATETKTKLFFEKGGNVGIDTTQPKTTFEVNGILGAKSRVGTYELSTVPADGSWHNIITGLNGCCAFEIMAQVGKEKTGKYSLVHAHALSTFGRSRNKIKTTQAHYGWWWNKIALRWTGTTYNYSLQMKTRSNYGADQEIKFHVTKLWDNEIMTLFNQQQ